MIWSSILRHVILSFRIREEGVRGEPEHWTLPGPADSWLYRLDSHWWQFQWEHHRRLHRVGQPFRWLIDHGLATQLWCSSSGSLALSDQGVRERDRVYGPLTSRTSARVWSEMKMHEAYKWFFGFPSAVLQRIFTTCLNVCSRDHQFP